MKNINDLVEKYRPLFYDEHGLHPANYGIACSDGWYAILDDLLNIIQHHVDHKNKYRTEGEEELKFQVAQIKEKFGTLRFYFDGGNEYINGLVRYAEVLSRNVCETCGSNQHVGITTGWFKVRCQSCAETEQLLNWKIHERN